MTKEVQVNAGFDINYFRRFHRWYYFKNGFTFFNMSIKNLFHVLTKTDDTCSDDAEIFWLDLNEGYYQMIIEYACSYEDCPI